MKDHDDIWTIGAPKSEHSVRTVRLSAQLTAALRHWLVVDRAADKLAHGWTVAPPWLFYADVDPAAYDSDQPAAGTLDDSNVRRAMRAVLRHLTDEDAAARVPVAEHFPQHFTPHGFRHTFASLLLSEGRSLQYVREQLGHESITLTADTYGAWLPTIDPEATDCLDDAEWASSASHHAG